MRLTYGSNGPLPKSSLGTSGLSSTQLLSSSTVSRGGHPERLAPLLKHFLYCQNLVNRKRYTIASVIIYDRKHRMNRCQPRLLGNLYLVPFGASPSTDKRKQVPRKPVPKAGAERDAPGEHLPPPRRRASPGSKVTVEKRRTANF